MTTIAVLRAAGLLVTGAASCEIIRRYDAPIPSLPAPMMPIIVNPEPKNVMQYAPLGLVGVGMLYFFYPSYVTAQQFKSTYQALQTQVSTISSALGNVKTRVLEKFGVVEARLDEVERTVLQKTAEIRRDVANVESMLAAMRGKVDKIEVQTRQCADGVGMLCGVVADNLNNSLENKTDTARALTTHAKKILNL